MFALFVKTTTLPRVVHTASSPAVLCRRLSTVSSETSSIMKPATGLSATSLTMRGSMWMLMPLWSWRRLMTSLNSWLSTFEVHRRASGSGP